MLHQSKRSLPHWILATFLPLSRLFVSAYREGGGGPYPSQLSVVLVATECRAVLRDASPTGRHGGSG
jgi:hypothetical protein